MKNIFIFAIFLASASGLAQDLTLKDVVSSGRDRIYCEYDGLSNIWKPVVVEVQSKEWSELDYPNQLGPKVDRFVFSAPDEETVYFTLKSVEMNRDVVMVRGENEQGLTIALTVNRHPGHPNIMGRIRDQIGDALYPGYAGSSQIAILRVGEKRYKMLCGTVKLPEEN